MHIYIFDYFLNQKKYEGTVAKIETRLTDLGLNGKNCHIGPLRSLKSIVKEELRNSLKTLVAVGNNGTFSQLINALEDTEIPVGIIPVGENNGLARAFGVDDEDTACNVLSARLIETINLGKINDYYFVGNAVIANKETIMEINGRYTLEPTGPGVTSVINLDLDGLSPKSAPQNGMLEVVVSVTNRGLISNSVDKSYIQTNKIIANNLIHKNFLIDNSLEVATPVQISLARNKLKVVVGKNRTF